MGVSVASVRRIRCCAYVVLGSTLASRQQQQQQQDNNWQKLHLGICMAAGAEIDRLFDRQSTYRTLICLKILDNGKDVLELTLVSCAAVKFHFTPAQICHSVLDPPTFAPSLPQSSHATYLDVLPP